MSIPFFFLVVATTLCQALDFEHDAPYYHWASKHEDVLSSDRLKVEEKLSELRKDFNGMPPNIIYILADDVGWGELGSYMGGSLRGTPSPILDDMASKGLQFMSAYSEPTCTPTRIALLTGRKPVRTGFTTVPFPGSNDGLPQEEVTVAEVLSSKGYATAMFGKWHVGELPEHGPENQGFDQSLYGLYNGAPFAWEDSNSYYSSQHDTVSGAGHFFDYPGHEGYEKEWDIKIQGIFRSEKGGEREQVMTLNSSMVMEDLERISIGEIQQFIHSSCQADKPFFIYWPTYFQQLASSPVDHRFSSDVDSRNNQAAQLGQHEQHIKQLLSTLEEEGIAGNTLVVWYSDNGPMYGFWPDAGYTYLKAGKGSVYEGGVRVPAFAYWPGVIEPNQRSNDIIHVTDLYTTAINLADAGQYAPRDRVIDGIDQSALFLFGSGHSHRNYVIHYSGSHLQAIRHGNHKMVFTQEDFGGYKKPEFYNIARDPAEKMPTFYHELHQLEPFMQIVKAHNLRKKRFPDRSPVLRIPEGYKHLANLFAPQDISGGDDCAGPK
eukprot:CAMPEP_0201479494 /NCGR_PEP_ID=MMETSP0151_2-20130828/4189_1 /ASSEMBLY_ACC=CAM_ASM_000257 /TAXON_ID=200890 /ORGANISM="Paramoeba atlantica, Strain 621/1 / CCAP 1560/9" /LENGTH=546 /DNA_ID=CAMNT_0047861021 /DNA_START=20 /DNA_END=1660 /DNA_ORIENTATION=-